MNSEDSTDLNLSPCTVPDGVVSNEEMNCSDEVTDALHLSNESQQSLSSYKIPEGQKFPKKVTRNPDVPLTRKRQTIPSNWKSEKAKRAKSSGTSGISNTGHQITKKTMGIGCTNCRFSFQKKFKTEQRQSIFNEFWSLGDHTRQWDYVARFIDTKTLQNDSKSKRNITNTYYLKVDHRIIKVCQTMFTQTLGKFFFKFYNNYFQTNFHIFK